MRPDAHHLPAISAKPCIGISVTLLIRDDLCPPEFGILLGPCGVLGAPVPKATIDEDSDARTRKRYVGDPAGGEQDRDLDAVTESESIEFATQCRFARGVLLSNPLHTAAHFR